MGMNQSSLSSDPSLCSKLVNKQIKDAADRTPTKVQAKPGLASHQATELASEEGERVIERASVIASAARARLTSRAFQATALLCISFLPSASSRC
jgi:hypothetical protein